MDNKWLQNKMFSWGPRVKASHNVNHVEDEKQDEWELPAPGKSHEDPGSEEQLSLPPGSRGERATHVRHLMFITSTAGVPEQPALTELSFLSLLTRIRYMCRTEVVWEGIFYIENLKVHQVLRKGSF